MAPLNEPLVLACPHVQQGEEVKISEEMEIAEGYARWLICSRIECLQDAIKIMTLAIEEKENKPSRN